MGWKGTVRSIAAVARAAERDAQRRHKVAMKDQTTANAANAVSDWENYVEDLISVHVDLADKIDWTEISTRPKPPKPELTTYNQQKAEKALNNFKPGLFDFFSGGTENKRNRLKVALGKAQTADQEKFDSKMISHNNALEEWGADTKLAERLIAGDMKAMSEVIREMQSFEEQALIGSAVSFTVGEEGVHAMPKVHNDEIIPNMRRKQLASGKLSETNMPIGQFNELYQDYVCSVALKVAGDLFHIIPLDEVFVTCQTTMLNSGTGHQELTPILSVQFIRDTFCRLNLANIDPSDSMRNFNHKMSFKKTKGFSPIEPLMGL